MKTLLLKEARLLLPFWVAALLLAVAPMWLMSLHPKALVVTLLGLAAGIVLLSVVPFGMEFSNGTFQLLLTQPVPRRRIWLVKLLVLTLALLAVLAVFGLSLEWRTMGSPYQAEFVNVPFIGGMMVLVGLAGGLWTTLLLRQIAAAIWFTPLVPGFLFLVVSAATDGFTSYGRLLPGVVVLISYTVLGLLWAAWLFQNAQDTQWTGETIALPDLRSYRARTNAATTSANRWLALLLKELHFHLASLLLVGIATLLHLAVILARKFCGPAIDNQTTVILDVSGVLVWFMWVSIPVVFGAVAIAEERKLGTADGHLCLPVDRRAQFLIKLTTVLVLSVVCAAVLPWAMLVLGLGGGSGIIHSHTPEGWEFSYLLLGTAGFALLSFYASTLARNTLEALGMATLLGIAGGVIIVLASAPKTLNYYLGVILWEGPVMKCVAWPVMLATLVGLAYANFKRLHEGGRTWRRNVLVLAGALFVSVAATAFVYNRIWELVMPLEPEHGPERISRPGRTKLCVAAAAEKHFVLLPDGRLWASPDFLSEEWTGFSHWASARFLRRSAHGFLPGSNWVDVATTLREAAAIQTDGSLWSVFRCPALSSLELKLSRIGSETNWIKLAAGSGHFLAIKRDGTLWGWGNNRDGELASNLPNTNQAPVQIGSDSNWAACFARHTLSFGVKHDGSVWMWGRYYSQESGTWPTKPVQLRLPGEGIKDIIHSSCVLYEDGRLREFSANGDEVTTTGAHDSMAADNKWLGVSWSGPRQIGLKPDGSLWKLVRTWDKAKGGRGFGARRLNPLHTGQVSKHSDWVAIHEEFGVLKALAADGTLCAWWQDGGGYWYGRDFLCLTRRSLGSVNIFESGTIESPP